MTHYGAGDWVDYARGVLSSEERTEMTRHLKSGCVNCARAHRFWQNVVNHVHLPGQIDHSPRKRESEVQSSSVISSFAVYNAKPVDQRGIQLARAVLGRLHPAKTQSHGRSKPSGPPTVQVLFQAGSFAVDLSMDPFNDRKQFLITGQILNSSDPSNPVRKQVVLLMAGGRRVVQDMTNEFGEFQFEFPAETQGALQILIPIEDQRVIAVPVPFPSERKREVA